MVLGELGLEPIGCWPEMGELWGGRGRGGDAPWGGLRRGQLNWTAPAAQTPPNQASLPPFPPPPLPPPARPLTIPFPTRRPFTRTQQPTHAYTYPGASGEEEAAGRGGEPGARSET